jgi:hypothetical protein
MSIRVQLRLAVGGGTMAAIMTRRHAQGYGGVEENRERKTSLTRYHIEIYHQCAHIIE